MTKLVIFVEEESMKVTLKTLFPDLSDLKIIAHQGASDLEKSLGNKLPAWRDPNTNFIILRDNDNADCTERKARLMDIVSRAGKSHCAKVRIVCQELEAWFLGDVVALERAGYLQTGSRPTSLRGNPDGKTKPSETLSHLNKNKPTGKVTRAGEISRFMVIENNISPSFKITIETIRRLAS